VSDTPLALPRPREGEYDPGAAAYIAAASSIHDADAELVGQRDTLVSLFSNISESRAAFQYAPGKWTVREVLGHLSDAERIFASRLLRIGRGDATPLPGFDENAYVPAGAFESRALADVLAEWTAVRDATVALVKGMPPEAWTRRGTANGRTVTAGALLYVIVGHTAHHLRVLDERYGVRPG
jgi:uncharacterized damage-inducible protein DinB